MLGFSLQHSDPMKFKQVQEQWEINPTPFMSIFVPPSQHVHQLFAALCGAAVRQKGDTARLTQTELERETGLTQEQLLPLLERLVQAGAARKIS
jgi:hypothetical protein